MFLNQYENFTEKGRDIIKKLAKDQRLVNCNDLFFKTGNPITKNFDFLKRLGTLYDLLIDLLNEKITILKATREQNEMISKIEELKDFISLEQESIAQRKDIFQKKKVL